MEKVSNEGVAATVSSLVEHYRQPIHAAADPSLYLQQQLSDVLPPVVQFQLDRLLSSDSDLVPTAVALQLIEAYPISIRPEVLPQQKQGQLLSTHGLAVLVHYELLLGQFLQSADFSAPGDDRNVSLDQTLQTLACDITTATAAQNASLEEDDDDSTSNLLRSNVVLPALVRMVGQVVDLCRLSSIRIQDNVLIRCSCSLLAFGLPLFRPRDMDATLEDRLCHLSKYLISSPEETSPVDISVVARMEWSPVQLDGRCWDDTTSVKSSTADSVWKRLAQFQSIECSNDENDIRNVRRQLLESLGWNQMAAAVRAHFFGRDMLPEQQVAKPRERLHLGRTVLETRSGLQKAYQAIPSRVHVALQFVSILSSLNKQILDDLLPVIYELLNSGSDKMIGMGAAALYHLLECQAAPDQHLSWLSCADNLLSCLDMVLKTCRVGPTLALTGLAQRHLFLHCLCTAAGSVNNKYSQRRRQATQQWLILLDRNNHLVTETLVFGLLIGGIVPLLYDHAMFQENADCLEVGRLGLSAVLPAIYSTEASHDESVKIAALVALQNLMVAAHPIMKRHAGKILSTLLAFLMTCVQDSDEQKLAQHVAATAVVICGTTATGFLNRIAEPDSDYEDRLIELALEIRNRADQMKASRNKSDK